MDNLINFRRIGKYLPEHMARALSKVPSAAAVWISEIRLRTNRPVAVSVKGENQFLTENGSLTSHSSLGIICKSADIAKAFKAVCDYSIHSYEKDIARGFITIEGGNRVGICGTAVGNGSIETIKYISGLNFRISGQAVNIGEGLCRQFFDHEPVGMLIMGVPLSGKTTMLKSMCHHLGQKYRISIIDERSEIGAVYHGEPQNDVGLYTDIFDGFDKKSGIETAVRVMSPQIVVCDEIGGRADCEAIMDSVNTGVKFLASVHGSDVEEVMSREHIKRLIDYGIFEYGVLLSGSNDPGNIAAIQRFGRGRH